MNRSTRSFSATAIVAAVSLACFVTVVPASPAAAAPPVLGAEMAAAEPVQSTQSTSYAQRNADVVVDGTRSFVVWAEDRGGGLDLFASRVGADGTIHDGSGVLVSAGVDDAGNPNLDVANPQAAVDDDGQYLVVWQDGGPTGNDVYAARVSPSGRVLDFVAIEIAATAADEGVPAVAWNGDVFLVTWQVAGTVRAARVDTSGTVLDPGGFEVAPAGILPAVAALADTFLVVYQTGEIHGRRVSTAGAVIDTTPIVVSAGAGLRFQPAVAAGTTSWFVAWQDSRNDAVNRDVFGARVTAAGVVSDPNGIPLSQAPGNQGSGGPDVAVNAGVAVVVWQDPRDGENDVFANRVKSDGTVLDGDGAAVAAGGEFEFAATVTAGPDAKFTAAYTRRASEAPYGGVDRIFLRTITSPK
jgi:hypothetical protein